MKLMYKKTHRYFINGNAGDIFAREIIREEYGCDALNTKKEGRLLLVGSIANRVKSGDVLCGVGIKSLDEIPLKSQNNLIIGLRGPLTYDAMKKAGFDLSEVKFLLDPGLIIKFYVDGNINPTPNKIGFIPHYRERDFYSKNLQKGVDLINIDRNPIELAKEILSCELLYSSSLHGIIFSHALNRPCIFVMPKTYEPLFKYQDYYASLSLPIPKPLQKIDISDTYKKPISAPILNYSREDFCFPNRNILKKFGILID